MFRYSLLFYPSCIVYSQAPSGSCVYVENENLLTNNDLITPNLHWGHGFWVRACRIPLPEGFIQFPLPLPLAGVGPKQGVSFQSRGPFIWSKTPIV